MIQSLFKLLSRLREPKRFFCNENLGCFIDMHILICQYARLHLKLKTLPKVYHIRKSLPLQANNRQGWNYLSGKNTLAYFATSWTSEEKTIWHWHQGSMS
jgi:hypothetical protein